MKPLIISGPPGVGKSHIETALKERGLKITHPEWDGVEALPDDAIAVTNVEPEFWRSDMAVDLDHVSDDRALGVLLLVGRAEILPLGSHGKGANVEPYGPREVGKSLDAIPEHSSYLLEKGERVLSSAGEAAGAV